MKKFYISTAISYPNAPPHIGHAYEAIAADAFARFKRHDGYAVHFVTGTDDHGQKIYRSAKARGMTPKEMTDRLSRDFIEMGSFFNISYDHFIRTSHADHHRAVRDIWRRMAADIYKGIYAGWYSVREEEFYTESELHKEGDEWRTPSGSSVEWVEEESYFFRLSRWQESLLRHYEAHPDFIQPESRLNEVVAFVKGGLLDLSISRSTFDWGVQAPTEDAHIVYVWLDALTNYLTACGYPNKNPSQFEQFWPADLHLIGKDVLRFHAVYWPAFLMSAGLPVPRRVFAHGMILTGTGEKMSKSLNNVIDPFEQAEIYGIDPFRYFLLREIPFGADGVCGARQIIHRLNADLANDLGNLAQRCLTMVGKHWAGAVPPEASDEAGGALLSRSDNMLPRVREAMDHQRSDQALIEIWQHISAGNRYFAHAQPWALDREGQGAVLWTVLELLRRIGIILQPFMPSDMGKLLDYLGVAPEARDFIHLKDKIKEGTELPEASPIFPRYKEEG